MAVAYGKLTGGRGVPGHQGAGGDPGQRRGPHRRPRTRPPCCCWSGRWAGPCAGREAFQELDVPAVFGPMAKWAAEAGDPTGCPSCWPGRCGRRLGPARAGGAGPARGRAGRDHPGGPTPARSGPSPPGSPRPTWPACASCSAGPGGRWWWPAGPAGPRRPRPTCARGRGQPAAGGGLVPLPGRARQPLPQLRRRPRGEPQPGPGRAGPGRPTCWWRSAPAGSDHHRRLPAAGGPGPPPAAGPRPSRPGRAGPAVPARPGRQRGRGPVPGRLALGPAGPGRRLGGLDRGGQGQLPGLGAPVAASPAPRPRPGPGRPRPGPGHPPRAPARRRHPGQRGRQLHRLGPPVLPVPAPRHPAGPQERGHGLRPSGGAGGQGRPPPADRGRGGRRR
jgi:hypothetical protein